MKINIFIVAISPFSHADPKVVFDYLNKEFTNEGIIKYSQLI